MRVGANYVTVLPELRRRASWVWPVSPQRFGAHLVRVSADPNIDLKMTPVFRAKVLATKLVQAPRHEIPLHLSTTAPAVVALATSIAVPAIQEVVRSR